MPDASIVVRRSETSHSGCRFLGAPRQGNGFSSLQSIPNRNASLDQMDDEKGDQVVLPALSNAHNGRYFRSVAGVHKVELKESREPALGCPSPHVILLSAKTSSDGNVDRLAGIAIGDDKDVDECAKGEKEA